MYIWKIILIHFLIFFPLIAIAKVFSPGQTIEESTKVICQDNNNQIKNTLRGGSLKCADDSHILIDSARLEISSSKSCPAHYAFGDSPPKCNELAQVDVLKYLTNICDHKNECVFSFATDIPQMRCLTGVNTISVLDNRFTSIRIKYSCRTTRITMWPVRRVKTRRKRVNLKSYRQIKKSKTEKKLKELNLLKQ